MISMAILAFGHVRRTWPAPEFSASASAPPAAIRPLAYSASVILMWVHGRKIAASGTSEVDTLAPRCRIKPRRTPDISKRGLPRHEAELPPINSPKIGHAMLGFIQRRHQRAKLNPHVGNKHLLLTSAQPVSSAAFPNHRFWDGFGPVQAVLRRPGSGRRPIRPRPSAPAVKFYRPRHGAISGLPQAHGRKN